MLIEVSAAVVEDCALVYTHAHTHTHTHSMYGQAIHTLSPSFISLVVWIRMCQS